MMRLAQNTAFLFVAITFSLSAGEAVNAEAEAEFAQGNDKVSILFADKSYEEAAQLCRRLIELKPKAPEPHYNLACALARLGKPDEALAALAKSLECGWADPAHLRADEDLAGLRHEKRFADALVKARENEIKLIAGTYDKPGPLPDVKTIEGFPEGGLRYVLRMSPKATAENPNRLIVWLHPSGGSANKYLERLVPRFLKSGFALLMPTHKQWACWTGDEAEKLLTKTLPEVAAIKGLDARKPVLLGFSAGANMMLHIYGDGPSKYAGFVFDGSGALEVPDDAEGKSYKDTPVLAITGELAEPTSRWHEVEPLLKKAGVPLTMIYVPDRGHTFLIERQIDAIIKWLDALPKPVIEDLEIGRKPSDKPAK